MDRDDLVIVIAILGFLSFAAATLLIIYDIGEDLDDEATEQDNDRP